MTPTIAALLYILLGLGICFAGYRLFRFYLMIAGFIVGFNTVMTLNGPTIDYNNLPLLAVAVIAGIVLALLAWLLYRFGVAIAGGLLGWAVASQIIQAFALTQVAAIVVIVVGVIIGVLIAFAITDLIIMVSTAIFGANTATTGLAMLSITGLTLTGGILVVITLVLAVLGFVTQWGSGGRRRGALL